MNGHRRENQRGRPSLQEVLARLDEEVKLLHTHLGGLPRAVEADHVLRQIWIDDVHNSTAIEGNTMTRAQVACPIELYRKEPTDEDGGVLPRRARGSRSSSMRFRRARRSRWSARMRSPGWFLRSEEDGGCRPLARSGSRFA